MTLSYLDVYQSRVNFQAVFVNSYFVAAFVNATCSSAVVGNPLFLWSRNS